MYSLNSFGFNKPPCNSNNRQFGSNTLDFNHTQTNNNMVLSKPEYVRSDHFNFLNNFGLQPHLITDKKFADINCVQPPPRNSYPSSYTASDHTNMAKSKQKVVNQQQPIVLKNSTIVNETCTKSEAPQHTMQANKSSKKLPKRGKRKHKQIKRETCHTSCVKSPHKIKNSNKPWHKTSLKFEIMEIEDIPSTQNPVTPTIKIETDKITLPIDIVSIVESPSISPTKSPNCPIKLESSHQYRRPSECESEDSFIVFDNSSNSFDTDILELDEFCYSSSGDEEDSDDDEDVCSIVSSLDDVWPTKRVRFADDKDLCEVHPMVQWSYAYQKARKGPWEQYALDRTRFQRRISDLESKLNTILQPEHRNKIYNQRFKETNTTTR